MAETLAGLAAEQECCNWATWSARVVGDQAWLEVAGPAEKTTALAAVFGT